VKIYSKFTDYYDYVTGYHSETPVWKRINSEHRDRDEWHMLNMKKETIAYIDNMFYDMESLYLGNNNYDSNPDVRKRMFIVGGKAYRYYAEILEYFKESAVKYRDKDSMIKTIRNKYRVKQNTGTGRYYRKDTTLNDEQWNKKYWDNPRNIDIHLELESPLIVISSYNAAFSGQTLTINPNLKRMGFTVLNPYQVYQDIEMLLGNQMVSQVDSSIPRTDKQKIQAHGMDPVYGFRKMPKE